MQLPREVLVMLTIDQREIARPGIGAHLGDGRSSFRRILVPVRSPGESVPALAAAARICGLASGVLRLVHVRTCDPPQRTAARFYRETTGQATAVLEEALLMAWACGGPRATTALVDARRGDVATAITWQASAWHADLIVLTRRPRSAIARLAGGSVADQVMRKASCPVLAVPLRPCDADPVGHTDDRAGRVGARTSQRLGSSRRFGTTDGIRNRSRTASCSPSGRTRPRGRDR
jgi:nucleotide-binding universal stress UspA family protein